jgi:transcription antitermination factor NusG
MNTPFPNAAAVTAPVTSWFCVRSQPRREALAARCLPTLANVEVFYPVVNYSKRTKHGLRHGRVALFPSYLFARFPVELSKQITYTLGVARLLRRGPELAVVPDVVMQELFLLAPDGTIRLDDPAFRIGEKIKIIAGAFLGWEGKVVRLAPAKKRISVLLEFLGQERSVDVPLDAIDALESNPHSRLAQK